jgi:ribosome-binding protein aMBF1 (putative translation factor)
MTPDRFRECLQSLQWSQRFFAGFIRKDDRLVRRWASGDAPIPEEVATILERITFLVDTPREK